MIMCCPSDENEMQLVSKNQVHCVQLYAHNRPFDKIDILPLDLLSCINIFLRNFLF